GYESANLLDCRSRQRIGPSSARELRVEGCEERTHLSRKRRALHRGRNIVARYDDEPTVQLVSCAIILHQHHSHFGSCPCTGSPRHLEKEAASAGDVGWQVRTPSRHVRPG